MEDYNQGRFRDAISKLEKAYRLKPEPVLLYNLARAYEGVGDLEHAVGAYRAFLVAEPSIEDRGAIEQRILTLDQQNEMQATNAREKKLADERPRSTERSPSAVPWIVVGVGAAGIVVGGVFGVLAKSREAAQRGESQVLASRDSADAKAFARDANIAFAVGGVFLAGGLVWILLDRRASPRALAVNF